MDKISGILPASARTSVADIASSQPARPGAQLTGRPEGRNSLGDRITLSKAAQKLKAASLAESNEAQGAEPTPTPTPTPAATYRNTPENSKKQVIDDLNKKFFSNPKELAREDAGITHSEEMLGAEDAEVLPITSPHAPLGSHGLPVNKLDTHP
ncbi:MAG TPA: hypothetical protein VF412_01255 [Bdellovibrio sp.]|uniref:hypothetical protein n=1 Tax=Bdellovibrio sp. TaxID=28201 RepID=UPI002EE81344